VRHVGHSTRIITHIVFVMHTLYNMSVRSRSLTNITAVIFLSFYILWNGWSWLPTVGRTCSSYIK